MKSSSDRRFLLGVLVGGVCGFVAGSVLAAQLGSWAIRLIRRLVDRGLGHSPAVRFDLLLQ